MRASLYLFASLLLAGIAPASVVEHPGVIPKDVQCTTCHAAKVRGKSVHSVMASSCDVCHITQTRGDMVLVMLSMPKQKICFACHEESAARLQHKTSAKGLCLDCHEAHSSERQSLLRVDALTVPSK